MIRMKNDKLPMLEIPPVVSAKTENQMKSESQWLSTDFSHEMIHGMPITVKDKNVGEIEGHLKVEKANSEGQMVVSAH
jgi:hypothetical protein